MTSRLVVIYIYIHYSLLYNGHLESSKHDIIIPQCVDKMLSNKIFLETRIQRLLDGFIFFEKGLGVHVQRMLKMKRYIKVGYNLDIMRQSACLVVNPITVYSYGFLFNCTTVGRASDSMTALT